MKFAELAALLREDVRRLSPESTVSRRKYLHPRFAPVLLLRLAHYCYVNRWAKPLSFVLTWLNVFLFGIEVAARCEIGPGLFLPHTVGTVIGAMRIGRNATIFQGVTLGAKYADLAYEASARPSLGDGVVIGAGAKVLGGIHLGDRSTVGANSLLMQSLPEGAVAIGVPAMIKPRF